MQSRRKNIKAMSSHLQTTQPAVFKRYFVLCHGNVSYQLKNSTHKNVQDSSYCLRFLCICKLRGGCFWNKDVALRGAINQ